MVSLQSGSQKSLELDNIFHGFSRDDNLNTLKRIKQINNNYQHCEFIGIMTRVAFLVLFTSIVLFNGYSTYTFCIFNLIVHLVSSFVIYSVYIKQGFLIENIEKYFNNPLPETVDYIVLYEKSLNSISIIKNYLMSGLIITLFIYDVSTFSTSTSFMPLWFNGFSILFVFVEYFTGPMLADDHQFLPNVNNKIYDLGIYKHNNKHTVNLGIFILVSIITAFISAVLVIMVLGMSFVDYLMIFGFLSIIAFVYYIYKIIYTNYEQVENQLKHLVDSMI